MVKTKKAIAMIELIFALVIMGIVLMSAPMLIQQSVKSSNVALQQEAIVAAASHTSLLLSLYWDERNAPNDENASNDNYGEILDINRTNFTYPNRNNSSLRSISLTEINATINTMDTNDTNETDIFKFDDVDDFNKEPFGLMIFNSESSNSDYVDIDINITTNVNFAQDIPTTLLTTDINVTDITSNTSVINNVTPSDITTLSDTNSTNIKFITVNLTSNQNVEELNKSITMKAFSCNIGQYSIYGGIK